MGIAKFFSRWAALKERKGQSPTTEGRSKSQTVQMYFWDNFLDINPMVVENIRDEH